MSDRLNEQQAAVVNHTDGPVLVIAAPGSGKTKTLVERTVHLIQSGVSSESIMIATFTEKAAKELVTRISNRLLEEGISANLSEMYIGTLHSLFLRFLEEHREFTRLKNGYRLLDEFEQSFIIYKNISRFTHGGYNTSDLTGNRYNYWDQATSIAKRVNVVSEEMLDVEQLKKSKDEAVQALAHCYEIYSEILADENALDFSTIQMEMLTMITTYPEVLAAIQEKLQYIMIDEYQDTNTIQERILLFLAEKHHNICVVGDDDQGLYRFRGATIRNILEFDKNFAKDECKIYFLTTNYRSHPEIIKFYKRWMNDQDWEFNGNTYRFPKDIKSCDREFPDTAAVVKVYSIDNTDDYHAEVLSFIKTLEAKNVISDYNQIAFLYKSVKNDKVIALANYLEDNGIRVFSPRSDLFFHRDEVRMIIGAFLLLFPMYEDLIYEEHPMRMYYAECIETLSEALGKDPEGNKRLIQWLVSKAKAHMKMVESTNYGFSSLLYQLLQFPLFAQFLDVDVDANKTDLRPAYNIGILTNLLYKFEYLYNVTVLTSKNIEKHVKSLFGAFLNFLFDGGISEYEDFDETTPSGCVSFMTIHQSKGLEFPITIVGSMNGLPRKAYDDLDETLQLNYYHKPMYEPIGQTKYFDFARLYYTAFSRAQNLLVLTGNEKDGRGCLPSKYLKSAWDSVPSWRDFEAFDMKKLELATVKQANIKHEYSFTSHILLYESCPLQFKFFKEFEFSEVRTGGVIGGSLLHQTIEDIHKAVLRGEQSSLTDDNITSWFNTNYALLVKQLRSYLHEEQQKAILKQVLRYRDNNKDRWVLIKEAEVEVSLVKEDYILKGKIDLVKGENGTVELVDFKSGDKPDVNTTDPYKRQQLNQYRRQLEVYAHIIEQKTGHQVSKMNIYYPKEEDGNPQITFPYRAHNVEATINSFEDVVHKIEKKDFSFSSYKPTEQHCAECDMRFYCHSPYCVKTKN